MRRLAAGLLLLALALCVAPRPAVAGSAELARLEKEFKKAIDKVSAATVACVAPSAGGRQLGSSGVIVSRQGLVLSDGDAGLVMPRKPGEKPYLADELEVRVPDLRKGGYRAYKAKVVQRERKYDTCLLRIEDGPRAGFNDYLQLGSSDDLRIGAFTFLMGNAFNLSDEGSPSLTAGVISNFQPMPRGQAGGRHEFFYTNAAVNPGVNGGPVVDVAGRLVGIVSTWVRTSSGNTKNPFQNLGKVLPIDRLRSIYANVDDAKELFAERVSRDYDAPSTRALETVLHHTAHGAYGALVSLDVKRKRPVSALVPGRKGPVEYPRYDGPVSGILVSDDGLVVTSLYNLTSTIELMFPQWGRGAPPEAHFDTGLADIEGIDAYFHNGFATTAALVGYHQGLGVALLQLATTGPADAGATGARPVAIPKAPAEAFRPGAFTLAVGNPFGKERSDDPLLSFGILSKRHSPDIDDAWRGLWQTDAGVTDANCGGAVLDIEGRLLGMQHIWTNTRHGRNSGIAFVVPWPDIAAALPRLQKGENFRRPFLGVSWKDPGGAPTLKEVIADTAAAAAKLRADDLIVALDDTDVKTVADCVAILSRKWSGETLKIRVRRGADTVEVIAVLGSR